MVSGAQQPGTLIVLCGPSGVGKSTISRKLAAAMKLKYIVSATTRPKRPNDDKGKIYDYITEEAFFKRLDHDEFLEYALVYDNFYGTPKHPTLDDLNNGEDVLLELDVQGAFQIRFQYPQALMIFIMPPDVQSLRKRLKDRGRDSEEDMERRFRGAKREIWMAKGSRAFDDIVINDDLERATQEIVGIIRQKKAPGGI
jgi:guanylate kinase